MALDSFWVQDADGRPVTEPAAQKRLGDTIEKVICRNRRLGRKLRLKAVLPSRTRVFREAPRVLIDNKASNTHTVIEVNGRDRPGFLYDVTAALSELNLQISAAKISTYGTRAVDVFYVKDLFGLKVTHESRLDAIRGSLLEAIREPDAEEERAPAKKTEGPAAAKPAARKSARKPAKPAAAPPHKAGERAKGARRKAPRGRSPRA